jgi:hypothetical protein
MADIAPATGLPGHATVPRNAARFGLWMVMLHWTVWRTDSQAAFNRIYIDRENWRDAFEAGLSPAEAAAARPVWRD